MEVTAANLAGINKSFQTRFNKARGNVTTFYKTLCMECPSSAGENVYGWLADLPQIGKVVGEYIKKRLQTLGYRLSNEKFGNIIEISRESIEDDQYGLYGNIAAANGRRAEQVPDIELIQLLCNAFSATKGKDYTGKAFFAADKKAHAKAKVAFTNLDTKKLSVANFQAAVASLTERVDAEGAPMFLAQDAANLWLVVTSDDQALAEQIVKLPTLAGGAANPNYQKAKLMILPGLKTAAQSSTVINDADALPWMLLDCSQEVKPFIFQNRTPFELTPNFSLTSDAAFNEDAFAWKTRGRLALGYGLPEYAYGSTGADAA
jgi:phage major head subunit gpT-like protein